MDASSFIDTLMSLAGAVDESIDRLNGFLEGQLSIDDIDEFDMEELGDALVAVRELQSNLAQAEAAVAKALEKIMPVGAVLSLPNSGVTLEKTQGQSRKAWNHDALKGLTAEAVVQEAINPDTGTLDVPPAELIRRAFDMAGISYWRVAKLRDANINPDLYSEKKDGKISFRIGNSAIKPLDEEGDFL